ncbi:MAG: chromate transporter, partial [Bauldia litoralis]
MNGTRNCRELFLTFLRLGLTAFGGPVAHLGYFREAFVERRRWFTDAEYADLVALCQFLPGPASSQVGIGIGLARGGLLGACAARLGFTLPAGAAMIALGYGLPWLGAEGGAGWLAGLKLAAAAVVAHALWGMARTLCPDRERASLAAATAVLLLLVPGVWSQVGAIAAAAVFGAAA